MLTACFVAYLLVLLLLSGYGLHRIHLTWLARPGAAPLPAEPAPPAEPPLVTVQLPLYNEACVAERLLAAVAALTWPRDRLEIQILDDSTDETTALCAAAAAALTAQGFWVDHVRRGERTGFKAGALAVGLARARGELLLVLDADFVPPPDLLVRTAGHFADPAVGMVQARWEHLNRDASALTAVQALLLDGHFAVEQAARARTGRFFNFNGTAGLWRRRAVEAAGGWHADTLTEDLDLSYRALLAGWRFVYRPDVAAPAELPAPMRAFKSQQFRWAKGSVQVARKLLPRVLAAPLPLRVKLEACLHLTANVPYLLTLLLALLLVPALAARARLGLAGSLLVDLPVLVASLGILAAYGVVAQRRLGRPSWRALPALPALLLVTAGLCLSQARAVLEALIGRASPFVRTPKQGSGPRRYGSSRSWMPVLELALAVYFAGAVVYVGATGQWLALPMVACFAAGFAWVGAASLAR